MSDQKEMLMPEVLERESREARENQTGWASQQARASEPCQVGEPQETGVPRPGWHTDKYFRYFEISRAELRAAVDEMFAGYFMPPRALDQLAQWVETTEWAMRDSYGQHGMLCPVSAAGLYEGRKRSWASTFDDITSEIAHKRLGYLHTRGAQVMRVVG